MATTDLPLDLVIRFSTSDPDVVISISQPSSTTALTLKQEIRSRLAAPASANRLRLIHAGKVLSEPGALSKNLNYTLPPRRQEEEDESKSAKVKGKQPLRERPPAVARVYIHCAVGDALTSSELSAEATAAQEADAALLSKDPQAAIVTATGQTPSAQDGSTTTPAPRGFDRLLTTGFTPAEVAALRTQFLAIQAHTHTPDTMPSGPELLALEEQWLDNTSSPATMGIEEGGGFGAEDSGGLEDMLYGNLAGFFWPIGAIFWLMREEGVWSRRRQISVLSGFLVNLTFGFLRIMS